MEKETITIASAITGAAVTAAAALVLRRLEKERDLEAHKAELDTHYREGRERGWLEGVNNALRAATGEREVFSDPKTS